MTFTPLPFRMYLQSAGLFAGGLAQARPNPTCGLPVNDPASSLGWQTCQAIKADAGAQLTCFQRWADSQLPATTQAAANGTAPANPDPGMPATQIMLLPALTTDAPDGKPIGCKNTQYSELSRFWELQRGTDCDTFALRGYRPISLAFVMSGGIESPPTIGGGSPQDYRHAKTKIQLSVRTKIAKGLIKTGNFDQDDEDSLWFGCSQQSYWQLFSSSLSGPFRTTDHESKVILSTRTRLSCQTAGITGFQV